jgi:hypothetical protein
VSKEDESGNTEEADKGAKKPTTSTTGVNYPQLQSKAEVPTLNFFVPLRSTEMEADSGDDVGDTTESQQYQAPSSQAERPLPIVVTHQ